MTKRMCNGEEAQPLAQAKRGKDLEAFLSTCHTSVRLAWLL
jgi:hypothetical protein